VVFNDINGDGIKEKSEEALAGRVVYADLNNDKKMNLAEPRDVTDENGVYNLFYLPVGRSYKVRTKKPSGWHQTTPTDGNPWRVTPSAGQMFSRRSFGETVHPVVQGTVYNDSNVNGKRDAGEIGIANVQVYVDANLNGFFDVGELNTFTNGLGNYSLTTPFGTFRVSQTRPVSFRATVPSGESYQVTLLDRSAVGTGYNFGNTTKVLLKGSLFLDANSNGTKDSDEQPLSFWIVYVDLDHDGVFDDATEPSVTTDTNGVFRFSRAPTGSYQLRVVAHAGYRSTAPANGYYELQMGKGNSFTGGVFGFRKVT